MMCASEEIKGFLGVSMEALDSKCQTEFEIEWPDFYALHSANGKIALRRMQLKLALATENPSVPMLLHLGKVVLNQVESKSVGKGAPVEGMMTHETMVNYLATSGTCIRDVMKDTVVQDSAFAEAMANNTDEQMRQRASGDRGAQNANEGNFNTGSGISSYIANKAQRMEAVKAYNDPYFFISMVKIVNMRWRIGPFMMYRFLPRCTIRFTLKRLPAGRFTPSAVQNSKKRSTLLNHRKHLCTTFGASKNNQ